MPLKRRKEKHAASPFRIENFRDLVRAVYGAAGAVLGGFFAGSHRPSLELFIEVQRALALAVHQTLFEPYVVFGAEVQAVAFFSAFFNATNGAGQLYDIVFLLFSH
jgi:hypothetical protein